jgi:hypothetical protein
MSDNHQLAAIFIKEDALVAKLLIIRMAKNRKAELPPLSVQTITIF